MQRVESGSSENNNMTCEKQLSVWCHQVDHHDRKGISFTSIVLCSVSSL